MLEMINLDLNQKRVMIREDFNVPLDENGKITNDRRIQEAIPTIKLAQEKKAKNIILLSHLGRPKEGEYDAKYSLQPVAERLSELLNQPVRLVKDWLNGFEIKEGEIVLCENVRFNTGEKKNDEALAKKMAALCDVFVMDAFGVAHRSEASTVGIIKNAPIACAGPLLAKEYKTLDEVFQLPKRPFVAIVAGSKISTKLHVLESLINKVDTLILGGGILNTYLQANRCSVGKSLYEPGLISEAKRLAQLARKSYVHIPIPEDVVVAKEFKSNASSQVKTLSEIEPDDIIMDIGPRTRRQYRLIILDADTIVWNGPVGVFEFEGFGEGTKSIIENMGIASAYSLAGGGDTLAALDKFNMADKVSYICTGGGALLEFIENRKLPVTEALALKETNK